MYCIRPVIHERPGWISRSTLSGRSGTCFGRNREWTRGTPPQLTAQVLLVASPGPVELFPSFTAAQGASSLRVRAGQTSTDTFRAHEHERAADMPSLPQAVCRSMRGRRDGEEAAPELAYSDGSRTHTRGVRTLEPRKPCRGCATALSSAPGARRYLGPESQTVLCLRNGGSPGRAVLTALCISVVLSRSPTDIPEPPLSPHSVHMLELL
jgi:hypothetical protein